MSQGRIVTLEQHGIRVDAAERMGGAIIRLYWGGKQFINYDDSGRFIQCAWQQHDSDGLQDPEEFNPTEGGQSAVAWPNKSASNVLGLGINPNTGRLESTCHPAFWKARNGQAVSKGLFQKSVGVEPWGLDIRSRVDARDADVNKINIEIMTGYMRPEFTEMAFVTPNGLVPHSGVPYDHDNSPYPCVVYTPDKKYAMGCISPSADRYALINYIRENVTKWSAAIFDVTPDPDYRFRTQIFVGDLATVLRNMGGDDDTNEPVPPMSDGLDACERAYLAMRPDLKDHAVFGKDPRLHWERHGRFEKGTEPGCDSWRVPLTCSEQYLLDHEDVAASSRWKDNPQGHYEEWGSRPEENRKVCDTWRDLYGPDKPVDPTPAPTDPTPPPADPNKPGLIICTDIARMGQRSDKNDQQGLLLAMLRFNEYNIEGLIATNTFGIDGTHAILEIINNYYEPLFVKQNWAVKGYPSPAYLRSVTFKGATARQAGDVPDKFSAGAKHVINVAKKYSVTKRLLYDTWGPNTTLAEVCKNAGAVRNNILRYTSGTWNREQDLKGFTYLKRFKSMRWIHDEGIKYGFVQPSRNISTGNRSPKGVQAFRNNEIYPTSYVGDGFKKYALDFKDSDTRLEPWASDFKRYKDGDLAGMYIRAHWRACKGQFNLVPGTVWHHSKVTHNMSKEQQKQFLLSRRTHVFSWIKNALVRARDGSSTDPTPAPPPSKIISGLPVKRMIMMDDSILSLHENRGGDYNHTNDVAAEVALMSHYGYSILAFGATCVGNNRGVTGAIDRRLLDEAGFAEVKVRKGSPTYTPARSPLSQLIVEESKKGPLTICIGGPCNDAVQAMRDGANVNNINWKVILRGTWNEHTNPNTASVTKANTAEFYRRAKNVQNITWYRDLLLPLKGVTWAENWIAKWRKENVMFNTAFGDFVNQRNRELNKAQGYKEGTRGNPIRWADFMTLDTAFGGQHRAANFAQVIARLERGLRLINQRIAKAKNT